jgi:hypothetical protein
MGNTIIPFDFNPSETKVVDNALYTVPANKHARISVLKTYAGNYGFSYDIGGVASSFTLRDGEGVSVSNTVATGAGTVTVYTVPVGYYLDAHLEITIGSSGQVNINGVSTFSSTTSALISRNVLIGEGYAISHSSTAGNTTTVVTGVLKSKNHSSQDFWLLAGDDITYPGIVLVQEFDNPS